MRLALLLLSLLTAPGAPAAESPASALERARNLGAEGRAEEAEALLKRLSEEHPSDPAPLVELGRLQLKRGALSDAARSLESASAHSTEAAILSLLGQVYLLQDRLDEARATLEKAVAGNPRDLGGHYNLGRLMRLQGEAEPALVELERALALEPDERMRRRIQSNLGLIYIETRRFGRALAIYDTLALAEPERPEWLLNLSSAHEGLGELRPALDAARRAQRLKPDLPDAQRRVAALLRALGDPAGALAAAQKAIELAPEDPAALALMAALHLDAGRAERAVEAARRLVARDPAHAQGHYLLGQALLARGEREEAEREFETHRQLASRRRAFQHTAATLGDD